MKFSSEPTPWNQLPINDNENDSNKKFLEALYQISNNAIMERKNKLIEVNN